MEHFPLIILTEVHKMVTPIRAKKFELMIKIVKKIVKMALYNKKKLRKLFPCVYIEGFIYIFNWMVMLCFLWLNG